MPSANDYYGFDIEALVNEYGPQFGVKPEAGMRVFQNEGLQNYQSNLIEPKTGKREPSYGAFQLYMGGGLGNEFQKATGLDPRNPATTPQQVKFAMEQASKGGWGPWKGAARAGMSNWEGITPQSASAITFKELPDAPAGGGLTFKELPDEVDAKGRIAQAFDSAVMSGSERVTSPESLAQRMQIVRQQRELGEGAGGAAVRGAMAGPFLGWQGEVAGGLNAADQYLQNLIEKGHGGAKAAAGQAYTNTVEAERIARQLDEANNPVARQVAEIGGSIAAPVGPLGRLATTGTGLGKAGIRALEAGGKAGVIGAIAGAGGAEGGIEDRLRAAQGGALLGGGIGLASRPVGAAVGLAARTAGAPVKSLVGAIAPGRVGDRMMANQLARDAANKDIGLVGQALDDALAAGKPVVGADVGGEGTRLLARSAKNVSPEAASRLQEATRDRFVSQAGRVSQAFDAQSEFAGMSPTAVKKFIEDTAGKVNAPLYDRAMKAGDRQIWNDELAQLTNAPVFQAVTKEAFQNIANRLVSEGGQAPNKANLLVWDAVKKRLDAKATDAFRSGDKDTGGVMAGMAARLRGILDREVPAYQSARSSAAEFFGARDAYEAGQKFTTASFKKDAIGQMKASHAKFTPDEKILFREGFIAESKAKLMDLRDNQDVVKAFTSPKSRAQFELALGEKGAAKMEAELYSERIMDQLRTAVSGNSTTVQQAMLIAGGGELANWYTGGGLTGAGAAAGLLRLGKPIADRRVYEHIGKTLADGSPENVRRLAEIASQSPKYMGALRNIMTRLSGVTGGENSQVGARILGGGRSAAAEEDQPR